MSMWPSSGQREVKESPLVLEKNILVSEELIRRDGLFPLTLSCLEVAILPLV